MEERISSLEKEIADLKQQLEERLNSIEQICGHFYVMDDGSLRWKIIPKP